MRCEAAKTSRRLKLGRIPSLMSLVCSFFDRTLSLFHLSCEAPFPARRAVVVSYPDSIGSPQLRGYRRQAGGAADPANRRSSIEPTAQHDSPFFLEPFHRQHSRSFKAASGAVRPCNGPIPPSLAATMIIAYGSSVHAAIPYLYKPIKLLVYTKLLIY
ncbi:hypothetical protein BKA63DRAFT_520275 [Paraphoma chrysanthemicola]|nr:hypothetical protein BKA63DRAFT_520275 [Paraphoma chrysanthemicola]